MKPRMVDGRMLVSGHSPCEGNVTIHLAVLRAFRPGESGDSVFIDGDRTNCRLENLRWETTTDRRSAAIAMAERSVNRWSGAFVGFWSGDRAALDGFFGVVVCGDTVAQKKPHPEPVLTACARLGIRPAEALMIGDSAIDVQAARAAGCPVWCVPYGYNEGRPVESLDCDRTVASIAEAAALIVTVR